MTTVTPERVGTPSGFPGGDGPSESSRGLARPETATAAVDSRTTPPEAEETRADAHAELITAVMKARAAGKAVPCVADPAGGWTSSDRDLQHTAADKCLDCSVFAQCLSYIEANPEAAGVWAGKLRISETQRRTRERSAARKHPK